MASEDESETSLQSKWLVWDQVIENGDNLEPNVVLETIFTPEERKVLLEAEDDKDEDADMDISDSGDEEDPMEEDIPPLKLREYQNELAEDALLGENTIIYAPTGSGKTLVSIHIIKEHLKKDQRKKVAFMAPQKALVMQQYEVLRKYLRGYKITCVTGDSKFCRSLNVLLPNHDIIVMTPMILVNHLRDKKLEDISQFSLLVLDECHHTRKSEVYSNLLVEYHKAKKFCDRSTVPLPQIIGMTASFDSEGADSVEKAEESIVQLCSYLDCRHLSTVRRNISEMKKNVPEPAEISLTLEERTEDSFIRKITETMQIFEQKMVDHKMEINNAINDPYQDQTNIRAVQRLVRELEVSRFLKPYSRKKYEYGLWVRSTIKKAKKIPIQQGDQKGIEAKIRPHIRSVIILSEYLLEFNTALQLYDYVELRELMCLLDKRLQEYETSDEEKIDNKPVHLYLEELKDLVVTGWEENPNLKTMAEILRKHLLRRGKGSCGIVFVKTRAMTEALVAWLEKCGDPELSALKPCSFTGSRASEGDGGMSKTQQESVMSRFRSGEVRLLIATSVAEEGIDIPECNLVILYNYVVNEVATVQTRGRCRANGGICVELTMSSTLSQGPVNRERIKLMEQAIERVQIMQTDNYLEFDRRLENYREATLREALHDIEAKQQQKSRGVQFSMVCPMCGEVSVESSYLRIIQGCHHVSVDRDFLDKVEVSWNSRLKRVDDSLKVGEVTCKGKLRSGGACRKKLGVLFSYKKVPFVVLSANGLSVYTGSDIEMLSYNKWSQVPFEIKGMTEEDLKKYINDKKEQRIMEQLHKKNWNNTRLPPPNLHQHEHVDGFGLEDLKLSIERGKFLPSGSSLSVISPFEAPKSGPSTIGDPKMSDRSSNSTIVSPDDMDVSEAGSVNDL